MHPGWLIHLSPARPFDYDLYVLKPFVTIVVPTWSASAHLAGLYASIHDCGLAEITREVVFVNDGSPDETVAVLEGLRAQGRQIPIRIITFDSNRGRFLARFEGAKTAQTDKLLFLDSRIVMPAGFGALLAGLADQFPSLSGHMDIDTSRDVFSLYWDRSHRVLFRRHYRDSKVPLTLVPENFDRYLKGTTIFYCSTSVFVETCRLYENTPLYSDDTFLMKEMVKTEPITVHPQIRIGWVPRDNAKSFLKALWDRGPGFAEYHMFERRGVLFWAMVLGILVCLGWVALAIMHPMLALWVLLGGLALLALSCIPFARSPMEFLRMAPLHAGVILAYGFGAVRGIFVIFGKRLRKTSSHASV